MLHILYIQTKTYYHKINNINVDEKGIEHELISIKDSLLDSELLREKKKKENYGILMAIHWAFNNFNKIFYFYIN